MASVCAVYAPGGAYAVRRLHTLPTRPLSLARYAGRWRGLCLTAYGTRKRRVTETVKKRNLWDTINTNQPVGFICQPNTELNDEHI